MPTGSALNLESVTFYQTGFSRNNQQLVVTFWFGMQHNLNKEKVDPQTWSSLYWPKHGYHGRLCLLARGQLTDPSLNSLFIKTLTICETIHPAGTSVISS